MADTIEMLYAKVPADPVFVQVPALKYLMVDGQGDPSISRDFRDAIAALYTFAYTMKFMLKAHGFRTKVSMPLQGRFRADDMLAFIRNRRKEWKWTLMILQPPEATRKLLAEARAEILRKGKLNRIPDIRLESYREGRCVQVMHTGPYSAEKPTIERLHAFIREKGCSPRGDHHEIYLSAPGRTAPSKLKTIIRQPVAPGRQESAGVATTARGPARRSRRAARRAPRARRRERP
jgi:hypothetical protein